MSERRRAAAYGEPVPPAPTDQRVWGRAEAAAASHRATGRRGGRAAHGYDDDLGWDDGRGRRSLRRDDSPEPPFEHRSGGRRRRSDPVDTDPGEERPRRGRRARGGDEDAEYRTRPADRSRPPGGPGAPPRRRGKGGGDRKRLGIGGWISIALTAVLVLATLTTYKVYRSTVGLIDREKSTDELDKNRPVNQTGALNVLLVGSDSRAGANRKYGKYMVNDSERTDTIMLLHVSPNRDAATLISFPRDSMVMIPACRNVRTGQIIPAHLGMINSAFSEGGMICTRRTIETLTGIRIDHFVKVDFTGFKNIINALGGIEICLPQPVNDRKSKLNLPAGRQVVKGEQALAYVRLRNIGDGSDISRIKRQQIFMAQVVKKATSSAMLTDVNKLTRLVTAVARSVTTDDALNTETLLQIAQSASKLSAKGFKATIVPWEPYPPDKNRVQWKQPDAENLFRAIRSDTEVTPSPSPSASASASKPTVTKPSQVKVQVFNGTNINGKAREVAEELSAQGFKVVGIGDARRPDGTDQPKTMIRYQGKGWDHAKVLAGKLLNQVTPETGRLATGPVTPFTPSSPSPEVPKSRAAGPVIQLIIGSDWKGVRIPLKLGDNAVTTETNPCQT